MLPSSAECVIIGGGVVGCSLAYRLGLHGVRAVVLEKADLGSGSTAKCAGGFRQQFSTEINVRIGMLSRRLFERFEEEMGMPAGLRQIGYLFLASTDEELRRFEGQLAMQQRLGLTEARVVSIEEISEIVPEIFVGDLCGGTFCPSDGLAGPNDVTSAYVKRARELGATFIEGCQVTGLRRLSDGELEVATSQGNISAAQVVNCGGAHAAEIAALVGVELPIRPYRRHIFTTESFSLRRPIPMTVDFHTSLYFHPEGDGLLLGMSDPDEPSSFNTSVDWQFLERLVQQASHRLPIIESATIKAGWAGLYEISPDNQAIVGRTDVDGFWICGGFSGHGFMQAPAIGLLLADQMVGQEPEIDLSPLSPRRFLGKKSLEPEAAVI